MYKSLTDFPAAVIMASLIQTRRIAGMRRAFPEPQKE